MKGKIISVDGKEKKSIDLPSVFSSKIREDIVQRYFEASKRIQPYAASPIAGKMYSASGKLKHRRHKWKTTYGKGISRVPRKIFWRRGTQFYWQGATVSGTVGGRKAHPPKAKHFFKQLKVNKKEKKIAFSSAIAATTSLDYIKTRYEKLRDKEIKISLPIIVESKLLDLKSKGFLVNLKKILDNLHSIAIQEKKIRAGRGKTRGRKYKKSAGLLLVLGDKEEKRVSGIETKKVGQLVIGDLWPLGRLTIYTEKAVEEIGGIFEGGEKQEAKPKKKREDKRKLKKQKKKTRKNVKREETKAKGEEVKK